MLSFDDIVNSDIRVGPTAISVDLGDGGDPCVTPIPKGGSGGNGGSPVLVAGVAILGLGLALLEERR
jgi:hypothetical protein